MPAIVRNIFEDYVKERFDLEDCIAVNNGTSALIAPLWSLDLKPGDEFEIKLGKKAIRLIPVGGSDEDEE